MERVTMEKGSFKVVLLQVAIKESKIIPPTFELGKDFKPQQWLGFSP